MFDEKITIDVPEKRSCKITVKICLFLLLVGELALVLGLTGHCVWLTVDTRKMEREFSTTQDNIEKIQELPVIMSAFNQSQFIELVRSAVHEKIRGDIEDMERDLLLRINASETSLNEMYRESEDRLSAIEERLSQADIQEALTEISKTRSTLNDITLKLNRTEDIIITLEKAMEIVVNDIDEVEHDIEHLQEDTHAHDGALLTGTLSLWGGVVLTVTTFMTHY